MFQACSPVKLELEKAMWVTRRTDYATRAVLALAMAEDAMNLDQLAEATESPRSVLEQVMPSLRAAGIVRFVRGPAGSYRLNLPVEELTLARGVRVCVGQL